MQLQVLQKPSQLFWEAVQTRKSTLAGNKEKYAAVARQPVICAGNVQSSDRNKLQFCNCELSQIKVQPVPSWNGSGQAVDCMAVTTAALYSSC